VTGASWAVSAGGVIVLVAVWLLLQHYHHLHDMAHPVALRVAIFFAYVAGCAIALSAAGFYVDEPLMWMLRQVSGKYAAISYILVVGTGLVLTATVVVALAKRPLPRYAYLAAATPFILALSGGALHGLLSVVPAGPWVTHIATWIGG
jgi:hypothetical protein